MHPFSAGPCFRCGQGAHPVSWFPVYAGPRGNSMHMHVSSAKLTFAKGGLPPGPTACGFGLRMDLASPTTYLSPCNKQKEARHQRSSRTMAIKETAMCSEHDDPHGAVCPPVSPASHTVPEALLASRQLPWQSSGHHVSPLMRPGPASTVHRCHASLPPRTEPAAHRGKEPR